MGRWSKRFDVKVVPRRYLHLYRCFGWTPTSPTATPQYDWERSPTSPNSYTSADISANLQDYDDLGLQRKEFVAVKRNTKFSQYKETYPLFFRAEKTFDILMDRYTVGEHNKRTWLRQFIYQGKRIYDLVMTVFCFLLLAFSTIYPLICKLLPEELGVPNFWDKFVDLTIHSEYPYIPFFVFACFFAMLSVREMWVRGYVLSLSSLTVIDRFYGKMASSPLLEHSPKRHDSQVFIIVRYYIIFALTPVSIFLALYAWGLLPLTEVIPYDSVWFFFTGSVHVYSLIGVLIHLRAFLNANPYATIKWLCLNARPVTKKILMGDMSMMSPQQRQRYQQGRIISSAVSDAMDRRDQGIKDDFYLGY